MSEKRELICPKCGMEFEDNSKEYPYGILCPACMGSMKGVIHPRNRPLTRDELETENKRLRNEKDRLICQLKLRLEPDESLDECLESCAVSKDNDLYTREIEQLRAALEDFKANGIRADLCPTNAHLWDVSQFYQYLRGIDQCVRTAASDALSDKPAKKISTTKYKIGFITHRAGAVVWSEKWMTNAEVCAFVNDEGAQQRCLEVQAKEFAHELEVRAEEES